MQALPEAIIELAAFDGNAVDGAFACLARRLRKGDREAFDDLVRRFWDPMTRFFWKGAGPEEAEDLSQDLFVAVYRALRRGGGPVETDASSWLRYLYGSARRQLIDHWRRRECREAGRLAQGDRGPVTGEVEWDGANVEVHPQSEVSTERIRAVWDCVGRLDEVSQSACWLVFVDGFSKREIARVLERPEASVRLLLVRSVAAIRRCLDGKGLAPAG